MCSLLVLASNCLFISNYLPLSNPPWPAYSFFTQVCLHCGEDFCRGDCLKYHYDQSQRKKKEPVDDLEVVENPKNPVDEEDEEKEKRPRMKRQMKRRPRPITGGSMYLKN